ncbi:creatininase family protein [Geobacter sp. DSM 9736]|uniref:creatininase family protein n=1 Tax=Geobacter sp. DSM 9736 TaxID=1277350 RepID=UPI000B5113FF|nr:creatininase family protein [Geobacter sp. DSM 9736]SNB45630.1 creatinine amidohydrolase [Geobacter sp. DSM 9736]
MIIEEMTMSEFDAGLKITQTVLIPFGSVEEHGDHLPLSTDTIQAYEVGKGAAKLIPLFVAPPIHYGSCRSTSCHPGTISISTSTLKSIMKDITRSLYTQGMRNVIVLTGHAGGAHRMALQDAGEELLHEIPDITIAVVTEYDLAACEGRHLVETSNDSHAGEIETSRILHSHPHLVKGDGKEEYPQFPMGILVRDKRKYWPGGVWGDPTKGTAEKGRLLEELVVRRIVALVTEIAGAEKKLTQTGHVHNRYDQDSLGKIQ